MDNVNCVQVADLPTEDGRLFNLLPIHRTRIVLRAGGPGRGLTGESFGRWGARGPGMSEVPGWAWAGTRVRERLIRRVSPVSSAHLIAIARQTLTTRFSVRITHKKSANTSTPLYSSPPPADTSNGPILTHLPPTGPASCPYSRRNQEKPAISTRSHEIEQPIPRTRVHHRCTTSILIPQLRVVNIRNHIKHHP